MLELRRVTEVVSHSDTHHTVPLHTGELKRVFLIFCSAIKPLTLKKSRTSTNSQNINQTQKYLYAFNYSLEQTGKNFSEAQFFELLSKKKIMLYFTLSEDHSVQAHGNRAKQWKKIASQQYSIFPSGKLSIFSLMAEVGCATAFPLAIQQCLIARMPVFSGSNRLANHYLPSEHTQESHLAERSPRGRTRSWLPSLPCLLPPEERQLP